MLSFTNVLLHASCTAAYVGRSRATALNRATRLCCDIFSPFFPLSSLTLQRQPSGHKHTCLTQLRSSKRPNISRVEVVFVCFFFFFCNFFCTTTGEGKKHVNHSDLSEVYSIFLTCELVGIAQKTFPCEGHEGSVIFCLSPRQKGGNRQHSKYIFIHTAI